MKTYSFSYTSKSDCTHRAYIEATSYDEAMALFKKNYGDSVDWFFSVEIVVCE